MYTSLDHHKNLIGPGLAGRCFREHREMITTHFKQKHVEKNMISQILLFLDIFIFS
jgi:hypothetical protein